MTVLNQWTAVKMHLLVETRPIVLSTVTVAQNDAKPLSYGFKDRLSALILRAWRVCRLAGHASPNSRPRKVDSRNVLEPFVLKATGHDQDGGDAPSPTFHKEDRMRRHQVGAIVVPNVRGLQLHPGVEANLGPLRGNRQLLDARDGLSVRLQPHKQPPVTSQVSRSPLIRTNCDSCLTTS